MKHLALVLVLLAATLGCTAKEESYSMADFAAVPKFDAHVHLNVVADDFVEQARADNFELLSINVDYPDFPSLMTQRDAAVALAERAPDRVHWATTFSMQDFGTPGWDTAAAADIAKAAEQGAVAVKVWKNVGMVERDADGELVMLDDPRMAWLGQAVQAADVVLVAHQGEPHNCWLPLEEMTTDNDREYFREHPQYHMYLHPEMPGYEDILATRDRFLDAHPKLRFVGAHMASLEYDVERLGRFLDRYPQASIDLAARMSQVQYQSVRDRAKVRDFFIRYQDRVLYGSDLGQFPDSKPEELRAEIHDSWSADWRYLATDETQHIDVIEADVEGLALPREVIDKIFYRNAIRVFALPATGK
jgi:predicted TIM-barrel fold metal-dependent hydrolase